MSASGSMEDLDYAVNAIDEDVVGAADSSSGSDTEYNLGNKDRRKLGWKQTQNFLLKTKQSDKQIKPFVLVYIFT